MKGYGNARDEKGQNHKGLLNEIKRITPKRKKVKSSETGYET
jgi:hypothetical protein